MSTATTPTSTAQSTPTRSRVSSRTQPVSSARATSPAPASAASAGPLSPRRAMQPLPSGSGSGTTTPKGIAQGRSVPSSPPMADRPKGRARDLLRKHYGLGVGPPPALGAHAKSLDPMDMDSPAFDAKSYYEQLITTSTLGTLIRKENELLSEIRQLDSERQSLVYNHHHELIDASETIAAVKTRAEGLDADLEKLKMAFSEISRLGAEIRIEDDQQSTPVPPSNLSRNHSQEL